MVTGFLRSWSASSLDKSTQELMSLELFVQGVVTSAVFQRLLKLVLVDVKNHMMLMWKHQGHSGATSRLNTLPESVLAADSRCFPSMWSLFSLTSWSLVRCSRPRGNRLVEHSFQDVDVGPLLIRLCRTPSSDWRSSWTRTLWIRWTFQDNFRWSQCLSLLFHFVSYYKIPKIKLINKIFEKSFLI